MYTVEYHSTNKKKFLSFGTLKKMDIMLSEISQGQKDKHTTNLLVVNLLEDHNRVQVS